MNFTNYAVRAAWVLPAVHPPICDGAVVVQDGQVVWVGPSSRAPESLLDLGDCALVPGWVNAHTHLEFSALDSPLGSSGGTFADWIRAVVAYRQSLLQRPDAQSGSARREAIRAGINELRNTGTAIAGEIVTAPATVADYFCETPERNKSVRQTGDHYESCAVLPFFEVLGPAPDKNERWKQASDFVAEWNSRKPFSNEKRAVIPAGISPHAPYSVHPALFQAAIDFAVHQRLPVAMHLAETREERELLEQGTGPLAELLRDLGTWNAGAMREMQVKRCIDRLATAPRGLLIHGNYLKPAELDCVAEFPHLSVVYCPRTHLFFQHEPYPMDLLRKRNIRVCIGTDSRASNPDLAVWKELQTVAAHHRNLDTPEILRMGTTLAAEALGVHHEFGSIQPGRKAILNQVRNTTIHSTAIRNSIDWLFLSDSECEPLSPDDFS